MSEGTMSSQDERVLASLAHGSILLGVLTSGVGGIGAALLIWLAQREKSTYAAFQALQAAVYQVVTILVNVVVWTCWGLAWMAMLLPPLLANPTAYENAPPAGLWIGLLLLVMPAGISVLTVLYGLWGAVRCWGGDDFRYSIIGRWLESHR
jgi:uncharacterized Tic20 family protein